MPAIPKPSRGERLRATFRRKRQAAVRLTKLYLEVYRRDGYRCVACQQPVVVHALDPFIRAHPHHIRPRSTADKALVHTKENICCVCAFCHADIHDKTLWISGNAEKTLRIVRERQLE